MDDNEEGLRLLRAKGYSLLAAVPDDRAVPINEYGKTGKDAVILGNEADGLPGKLSRLCDAPVTIPISSDVDSLNVGVAAAIFLFYLQT